MELEISYRHFQNGDFGDLSQVEFGRGERVGAIDFWSSGYVGIHLVNTDTGQVLINSLLSPEETQEINTHLLNLVARLTGCHLYNLLQYTI